MKCDRYKLGVTVCAFLLVAGCILQTLAGYSCADPAGHAWGLDDAYISYRYAENFARGHGLVFNPGERVEGYSNFLYTLLISPAFFFTDGGAIYLVSTALNIGFIIVAFSLFHKHVRKRIGRAPALAAALLFALCPSIWVWVSSGMESALVLVVQLSVWILVERVVEEQRSAHLAALCGAMMLAILARADGFVLPLIAIAYVAVKGRARVALYCAGAVGLTVLAYFLWRHSYYGYFLPNTYYVKLGGSLGARITHALKLLGLLAIQNGLLPYLLAFFLVAAGILSRAVRGEAGLAGQLSFEVFFAFGWLGYFVYIGGDFFQERFLVILYPLGIYTVLKIFGPQLRREHIVAIAALALFQLSSLFTDIRFHYAFPKYDRWVALGRFLEGHHPSEMLAIDAAGKVPYFSGLRTIDMLGLNDEFIAHQPAEEFMVGHMKFDPDYVLSRNPGLIAGWMNESMNMTCGMSRGKYARAGYRIRYLVNSKKNPAETNIIDASGMQEGAITNLVGLGYNYAVLQK